MSNLDAAVLKVEAAVGKFCGEDNFVVWRDDEQDGVLVTLSEHRRVPGAYSFSLFFPVGVIDDGISDLMKETMTFLAEVTPGYVEKMFVLKEE